MQSASWYSNLTGVLGSNYKGTQKKCFKLQIPVRYLRYDVIYKN